MDTTPEKTIHTLAAEQRALILPIQAQLQREAVTKERELKSFYFNWVCEKLNLTKYR